MLRVLGQTFCILILLLVFFIFNNQEGLALTASIGPDGCNAKVLGSLGFTGQGVIVGVFSEAHALVTHEAFYDKDPQGYSTGTSYITWFDATGNSTYEPFWHDTQMAGIVASHGGKLYPVEIGVAPKCNILSVRITRPVSQTDPNRLISGSWVETGLEQFLSQNGKIVVTGIQLPFTPDGLSQYSLIYDYYAYWYDLLFINAAGNYAAHITVFGDAYNGITTGGLIMPQTGVYRQVGTGTNPGPTMDGRRKPEIMAPAQNLWLPSSASDTTWTDFITTGNVGYTSWAGPHAAGVAALLCQYVNNSPDPNDNHSAVVKAVMVNSTFPNIKDKAGYVTTGQTWDARRGYGRVDALRAYSELSQPRLAAGSSTTHKAGWNYQSMSSSATHTYSIYGHKNQRLMTTVTWHRLITRDDVSGIYYPESSPFNVNLYIYDPQGVLIFSDADTADNLRKADILLPSEGYYQVKAVNSSIQDLCYYAMAFELLDPLPGDFNVDSIVDTTDLTTFAALWLATGCADSGQPCHDLDLLADGQINYQDMAIMAANWFAIDPRYYLVP